MTLTITTHLIAGITAIIAYQLLIDWLNSKNHLT
mgnify:FL=1